MDASILCQKLIQCNMAYVVISIVFLFDIVCYEFLFFVVEADILIVMLDFDV